jgi:hypothetical protein
MKKMFFLMLTLIVLGAASVNAQVRIGGTADPDKSAVLDLNPNEGNATGGLALPRVELTSETQQLNGTDPQPGTMVYNTSADLDGEGTYVWTKVSGSGEANAITAVNVEDNGLTKSMSGTETTLGLPAGTAGQLLTFVGSSWVASDPTIVFLQAVLEIPYGLTDTYYEAPFVGLTRNSVCMLQNPSVYYIQSVDAGKIEIKWHSGSGGGSVHAKCLVVR